MTVIDMLHMVRDMSQIRPVMLPPGRLIFRFGQSRCQRHLASGPARRGTVGGSSVGGDMDGDPISVVRARESWHGGGGARQGGDT